MPAGRPPLWQDDEVEFVRGASAVMADAEIARLLSMATGRTVTARAVNDVRELLGLRRASGRNAVDKINW